MFNFNNRNKQLDNKIDRLIENEEFIMYTLDQVIANASDMDTVIDSAVQTINGLQAQVAALKTPQTDPETAKKIDALNADISANKAKLAAAIVVNTPSVPPVNQSTPVVQPADANAAADASVKANPIDLDQAKAQVQAKS